MFRKASVGLIAALVVASAAITFAQFGRGPGAGRGGPQGGRAGGMAPPPGMVMGGPSDMAISGSNCYLVTGRWLHKITLSQEPSLQKSVDLLQAVAGTQGGQGPPRGVMAFGRARVEAVNGRVYVLAGQNLVEYDLNLNTPQVRSMAGALREAMQQQGPPGMRPGQGRRGAGQGGQGRGQRGMRRDAQEVR